MGASASQHKHLLDKPLVKPLQMFSTATDFVEGIISPWTIIVILTVFVIILLPSSRKLLIVFLNWMLLLLGEDRQGLTKQDVKDIVDGRIVQVKREARFQVAVSEERRRIEQRSAGRFLMMGDSNAHAANVDNGDADTTPVRAQVRPSRRIASGTVSDTIH